MTIMSAEFVNTTTVTDATTSQVPTGPLYQSQSESGSHDMTRTRLTRTVHAGTRDASTEIKAFHDKGFQDFTLDLTCLSPPPSPPGSIYTTETTIRSATVSPSPRHSISLSFRSPSPSLSRQSKSKISSRFSRSSGVPLSPITNTNSNSNSNANANASNSSLLRGSWPLMRYVGRGTPINKSRMIEWGVASNENENENGNGNDNDNDNDVGEDGVLYTTARATSIDSTARHSQRTTSSEWNILNRRSSTVPSRTRSRSLRLDPPTTPSPEIQIEGLGSEKPGEWSSFMQTVLDESSSPQSPSSSSSTTTTTTPPVIAPNLPFKKSTSSFPTTVHVQHPISTTGAGVGVVGDPSDLEDNVNAVEPTMSPEEIQQLDAELDKDLGIDGALDLGLGLSGYRGGMNWFDLGMLPASGRESQSHDHEDQSESESRSVSLYSSSQVRSRATSLRDTRRPSSASVTTRPSSVRATRPRTRSLDNGLESTSATMTMTMKEDRGTIRSVQTNLTNKSASHSSPTWWRRMLSRLRKVHLLISSNRH